MTALSINLNKIALLRNSRDTAYPSVLEHARACLDHGADGITVHPRPDQRHIRASDCRELATMLAQEYPQIEFNIEGNPLAPPTASPRAGVGAYPGFMALVAECRPAQCTLVPDGDDQLTSDHGFNLHQSGTQLEPIIAQLRSAGVRVSVFMDPDPAQMTLAAAIGAHRVELYTEAYAKAYGTPQAQAVLQRYVDTAAAATAAGLQVNAGHDLNLHNLGDLINAIPAIAEVSIGHAFTVDCIAMGLPACVRAYKKALTP